MKSLFEALSMLNSILMPTWFHFASQNRSKIHKMSTPRGSRKCIHFRFVFGPPKPPSWDPTWNHLGPQFRFKTAQEASQTPPRGLPDPTWCHLGSQIRLKTAHEASGTSPRGFPGPSGSPFWVDFGSIFTHV